MIGCCLECRLMISLEDHINNGLKGGIKGFKRREELRSGLEIGGEKTYGEDREMRKKR